MLHHLALDETNASEGAIDPDSIRGHFGAKAIVQDGRRVPVHAGKRIIEAPIHPRGEPAPDIHEARVAIALRQPLEKRRAREVREVAAGEVTPTAELSVVRQASLDRPLPERRRPPDAVRPARTRHDPLDIGRIAFDQPSGRADGDRAHAERGEAPERARERITGWPR